MHTQTWHRGFDTSLPNLGRRDGWGLWLTDNPAYAALYPCDPDLPAKSPLRGTVSVALDMNELRLLSEEEVYELELDAWMADPETCAIITKMGFDGWRCRYEDCDAEGLCVTNPKIIRCIQDKVFNSRLNS